MSILTQPRFSFERPPGFGEPVRRVRTAWISDVHLGTRTSNAEALLQFLRDYECEKLYVVGDLIDIWSLRRGRYWPQTHNDVIQKILRKARKGVPVIYIPGNHDEFVSTFDGCYGNISIQKHAIHVTADGRRVLIIHGHELDTVVQNAKWLAYLGDVGSQAVGIFVMQLLPRGLLDGNIALVAIEDRQIHRHIRADRIDGAGVVVVIELGSQQAPELQPEREKLKTKPGTRPLNITAREQE